MSFPLDKNNRAILRKSRRGVYIIEPAKIDGMSGNTSDNKRKMESKKGDPAFSPQDGDEMVAKRAHVQSSTLISSIPNYSKDGASTPSLDVPTLESLQIAPPVEQDLAKNDLPGPTVEPPATQKPPEADKPTDGGATEPQEAGTAPTNAEPKKMETVEESTGTSQGVPRDSEVSQSSGSITAKPSEQQQPPVTSRSETSFFSIGRPARVARLAEPVAEVLDGCEKYKMQHRRRGVALIFNHETFDSTRLLTREGADKDGEALQEVLRLLSFEVRYHKDLKKEEILKILKDVSKENHQDADCLFVAVMTHGARQGVLYAKDTMYYIDDVWQPFVASEASTLNGKPKIFLFEACRARSEENSRVGRYSNELCKEWPYLIPKSTDFLIAHFSMEGYYTWASPQDGSWFVQEFCQEIKESGRRRDLLTVLTLTLKRMAANRIARTQAGEEVQLRRKMPVISSTLSKLVYFSAKA